MPIAAPKTQARNRICFLRCADGIVVIHKIAGMLASVNPGQGIPNPAVRASH